MNVFPKEFPDDICHGYRGGTHEKLKRNLHGSKSAPKLLYKCLYQFIIDFGFNSVAGHSCLFIRVRIIAGNSYIVIIGILWMICWSLGTQYHKSMK